MKKWIWIGVFAVAICLCIYPNIEIDTGDRIIKCSYSDDFSEFEKNQSYNERYCYNEKYDASIYTFDVHKFLFFYVISMEYVEGDMRETEFILEEEYIKHFLSEAEITYNSSDIDIGRLIEGKKAIVGNTRYLGNDYENFLEFILDERYEIMYVFWVEDLLVIQVGSPDECPRFIAYN